MNTNRLSILRQNAHLRAFSRTKSLSLSLSSATVIILLASSRVSWGQLDVNDPWPKFGRDERNTCRYVPPSGADPWIGRGPHSEPELRWWAPLGPVDSSFIRGGAVVFKVNGVRYVAVGGPDTSIVCDNNPDRWRDGRLSIFRFHPCDPEYLPEGQDGGPAAPVAERLFEGNCDTDPEGKSGAYLHNIISSTPLVLADDKIIVIGHTEIWMGDLADLERPTGGPVEIPEIESRTDLKFYGYESPGYGLQSTTSSARVFIHAQGTAFALNLDLSTFWSKAISADPDAENNGSPAVGPLAGSSRNLVYMAPDFGADDSSVKHFTALYADGNPILGTYFPVAWQGILTRRYYDSCSSSSGRTRLGSLGSPSIHDNGDVVIPSDDGALYPFDNTDTYSSTTNNERWSLPNRDTTPPYYGDIADYQYYMSCTAGLTADRQMLFWTEDGKLHHAVDDGTALRRNNDVNLQIDGWVFGAPVLDTASRVYVATPGAVDDPVPDDDRFGREVIAIGYSIVGLEDEPKWTYRPSQSLAFGNPSQQVDLRKRSHSPLAMDEDGTLYVVNEGYILALRPLRGDFDGDGCRNNFDIDPFVEALLTPLTWDANYGAPIGINLLGVGDCNNDGVFNNFDIDCFVELVECCNNCGESGGGGGDSPSAPSSESGVDPQWEYFYAQIDWLRRIYGMDAP